MSFKPVKPKSVSQENYVESILRNEITICTGQAGTGKTLLALNESIKLLKDKTNKYKDIIIIRPYMPSNTGEKIGALPGELTSKVGPYVESIKDNLKQIYNSSGS